MAFTVTINGNVGYRVPKPVQNLLRVEHRELLKTYLIGVAYDLMLDGKKFCCDILKSHISKYYGYGLGYRRVWPGGTKPSTENILNIVKRSGTYFMGDKWLKVGIADRAELDALIEYSGKGGLPYWKYVENGYPTIYGYRFLPAETGDPPGQCGLYGEGIMIHRDKAGNILRNVHHPGHAGIRMFARTIKFLKQRGPIEVRRAVRKYQKDLKSILR